MTRARLRSVGIWMVGGAMALLLLASPALSRPSVPTQAAAMDQLLRRVVILEERVQSLQKQVDLLQNASLQESGWLEQAESYDSRRTQQPSDADTCDPPYSVDARGVRHFRLECLDSR